jgi:hypothetical protein
MPTATTTFRLLLDPMTPTGRHRAAGGTGSESSSPPPAGPFWSTRPTGLAGFAADVKEAAPQIDVRFPQRNGRRRGSRGRITGKIS